MPKVSVVIPTYNRAHLLPDCLNSVLAQSFRDFEVIVIDDGSTDNTSETISAFPVRYLWQENQGIPAARNKGIELSEATYIAFLDSDDAFTEGALEKGVDVLDKHPEAAFSYGQAYIIDEKGRVIGLEKPRSEFSCVRQGWEELRDYLLSGNHFTSSTVMVRRSCLEEVGIFDLAFRSGSEDLELWVRMAKRYAVAYIAEPLAKFTSHSQSFSASRSLREWGETNSSILESIFNDVELGPLFSDLRPVTYFRFYSDLADAACFYGDVKIARDYLYRAVRIYPRGLLKRLGLHWIREFIKTWMPQPVLATARSFKRSVRYLLDSKYKRKFT